MGNSASSEIKQQTQHHDSWVTPEDHLKHKHQHIPVHYKIVLISG
jgi:hypothetical protein